MIKQFGLIGKTLSHSFSKKYFEAKFKNLGIQNTSYELFPLTEIKEITSLLANNPNLKGFNVTIPYKESIIPFLDELSPEAKIIGAVNTVKVTSKSGKPFLTGYNTDAFGFKQSVKPFIKSHHERVLVLGTGGAAKAVNYVLQNMGINTLFVSRVPDEHQIGYDQINEYVIKHHYLIINCTPVGMFPNENSLPNLPYSLLTDKHTLIDLIYNPTKTLFLKKGKEFGANTLNGLSMLQQQAEKSWLIWSS
jgi:shikimate dehydrogenase